MKLLTSALVFFAISLQFSPAYANRKANPSSYRPGEIIEGPVTRVRDGDTIVVGRTVPVRIANLDCAESGTRRGDTASARARSILNSARVSCQLEGRKSYDREVGVCRLSNGQDFGEVMIAEGLCKRWRGR